MESFQSHPVKGTFSILSLLILPTTYNFGSVLVLSLDNTYCTESYGVDSEIFGAASFFIVYLAAAISNFIVYSFPKGNISTIITFLFSAAISWALKIWVFVEKTDVFYCDVAIGLLTVSFFTSIFFALFKKRNKNTGLVNILSISSIFLALAFAFFNFRQYAICMSISRTLLGFAYGIISNQLSSYLNKLAPDNLKGAFSSFYVCANISGGLLYVLLKQFATDFLAESLDNSVSWAIPILLFLCPCIFKYCIKVDEEESTDQTLLSLIKTKEARKSIFCVVYVFLACNLCGINQIFLNPESIFGSSWAFHYIANLLLALVLSLVNGYMVERIGRKKMYYASILMMYVGCLMMYFGLFPCMGAYIVSSGFNLASGNMPYILMGEIFPRKYLNVAFFIATTANFIFSAISTILPQAATYAVLQVSFLIYAIVNAFTLCYIYKYIKETKGKEPDYL